MKLSINPFLPISNDYNLLKLRLQELLGQTAIQVNNLSDGLVSASLNSTSAPTTGSHSAGDKIMNNAPTELGVATQKYVIIGWICTVSGTPGTWLQMRTLTGN